jgi:hypothetical protein
MHAKIAHSTGMFSHTEDDTFQEVSSKRFYVCFMPFSHQLVLRLLGWLVKRVYELMSDVLTHRSPTSC